MISEQQADGVLWLRLNQPEVRNALSVKMREALIDAFIRARDNETIRAVVLTTSGPDFCAGGDIRTMGSLTTQKARERMAAVSEAAMMIAMYPKPVIAGVRGHAAGAGVSLALLADYIVASEDAVFTFSFMKLALGPDWGLTETLPRRVGASTAKRLLLFAERIDAAAALRMRLIDHKTSTEGFYEELAGHALTAASIPLKAYASVKAQFDNSTQLDAALQTESELQTYRFVSDEHKRAFEKLKLK